MHVRLRWPDGTRERVYSPSLVLAEHLAEGTAYTLDDFARRSRDALTEASERVRAKYGFPCARAVASPAGIEARVRQYSRGTGGEVLVEAVET